MRPAENATAQQNSRFDLSEGGSGRTAIWRAGIDLMIASPVSLVTGFGWNSWFSKGAGFILGPHNQYLALWFELGLIGLCSYLGIVWQYVSTARFAMRFSSGQTRRFLVAFVFGSCAVAVAIIFMVLSKPWPYIWAYVGASCRIAIDSIEAKRARGRKVIEATDLGSARSSADTQAVTRQQI